MPKHSPTVATKVFRAWSSAYSATNWPAYIATTADLLALITVLEKEGRVWHFDDTPSDIITFATGKPIFTPEEAAHLETLVADCDALGGIWTMIENEPGEACAKLLGIAAPDEEPATT